MVLTMQRGVLALVAIVALAAGVLLFSITSLASPEAGGPGGELVVAVDVNVADDPDGHAEFIDMPSPIGLIIDVADVNAPAGDITIGGLPPWVNVTGAIQDGQIFASGSGKVAGIQDIAVIFEGKLDGEGLSGQYRMGTDLGLPPNIIGVAHPIKYTLKPAGTCPPGGGGAAGCPPPADTPPASETPTATPTPTQPGLATATATPTPVVPTGKISLITTVDLSVPDMGGDPAPGFNVNLYRDDNCLPANLIVSGVTDQDGVYSVAGQPQGDYSASVKPREGWNNGEGFCFGHFTLVLDGNITGVNVNLKVLPDSVRNGDVNKDGVTNSLDVLLVLQTIAGLISPTPNFDRADVNEDGEINAVDSALMLQFEAGLLDSLPVEQ